jgi:hypothetical protein
MEVKRVVMDKGMGKTKQNGAVGKGGGLINTVCMNGVMGRETSSTKDLVQMKRKRRCTMFLLFL